MSETQVVYVVRDAGGEYVRGRWDDEAGGLVPAGRTPASNEAAEFETAEEARAACDRATDRVLTREVE